MAWVWRAYVIVLHVVIGIGLAAWLSGSVGGLDSHHVSIRTARSEDVGRRLGLDWGPGLRVHVVRYKYRDVMVIHEGPDSLDQIDVSPPGSKLVWHYTLIPTRVSGLPSELSIDVMATDRDAPLQERGGEVRYLLLDSDADGMPDLKKAGGEPGSASLRLRRDAWVPKDHPDAMPDREPAPR